MDLQDKEVQKIKVSLRKNNEEYLRKHPEIQKILKVFVGKVLQEKPDNILTFAGNFLTK